MNLQQIHRSRKPPIPGDLFAMFMPGAGWLYGRVIAVDARVGPMEGCVLIYIYRHLTDECRVPDELAPELLIPPQMTNTRPWSMGYFRTIAHVPLRLDQLLPVHCFYDPVYDRYFNERNQQLSRRTEPCGFYALGSYRTIDDEISEALGIPLAPDDRLLAGAADGSKEPRPSDPSSPGAPGSDQFVDADAAAPGEYDGEVTDTDESGSAQHHVRVCAPSRWPRGAPEDLMTLEDALEDALRRCEGSELDGHEIGPDGVEIFLYGPDADCIVRAIRPVLRRLKLGECCRLLVRHGEPGAPEEILEV